MLKNFPQFQSIFGFPSFFFILDTINSFLSITSLKKFRLPIGALVTTNINPIIFDYPFFAPIINNKNVYIYYFFIIRLIFYGLQKRKKIY